MYVIVAENLRRERKLAEISFCKMWSDAVRCRWKRRESHHRWTRVEDTFWQVGRDFLGAGKRKLVRTLHERVEFRFASVRTPCTRRIGGRRCLWRPSSRIRLWARAGLEVRVWLNITFVEARVGRCTWSSRAAGGFSGTSWGSRSRLWEWIFLKNSPQGG